jgi:hypothetical protein
MMIIKNEQGMSLVQVMIGFGLAGVLALVIGSLMTQMTKTQKLAEVKQSEQEVWSLISSYVKNNVTCNNAFIGSKPGVMFNILEVNPTGQALRLEKDIELGKSSFITQEMKLLPNPAHLNEGLYEVQFELTSQRKKGDYFMAGTHQRKRFSFLAKLCEPTIYLYRNPFERSLVYSQCDSAADAENAVHHFKEPEAANAPESGALTCFICNSDKTVYTCEN